jgi:hypothetical protein
MTVRRITYRTLLFSLLLVGCAPAPGVPPAAAQEAHFSYDDLKGALEAGGATIEPTGELEQAFFSVNGRTARIDGADVQVFEYADEASRLAESSLIAPDGGSIGTTMVTWVDQPTFWAKGRLIVLYVGREAAVIENLGRVLGDPLTEPWPTP